MNGLLTGAVVAGLAFMPAWNGVSSAAIEADDLLPLDREPLAPRGGILMTKVTSSGPTTGWPTGIDLVLQGEGAPVHLAGHLAWIEESPTPQRNHWSWNGNNLAVRTIRADDDLADIAPMDLVTGPYLLVELPNDADGSLLLGDTAMTPRWIELPASLPSFSIQAGRPESRERMEYVDRPDRPVAGDPFTWWRWTLLADRLGLEAPPPPSSSKVEELVARHVEQLWRIGFGRLAARSRGVAGRCRDLLTDTSSDGDTEFAIWVTDHGSISQLLQLLLDREQEEKIDEHALAWADYQVTEVVWVEQAYGERITLAVAAPAHGARLAELIWHDLDDTPLGIPLDAGKTRRIVVDRPPGDIISDYYPELDMNDIVSLNIVIRNHVLTLPFGPGTIPVKPPGALLGPLQASLTLAGGRAPTSIPVAEARITYAQLRRFNDRWELFLECLRPDEAAKSLPLTGRIPSLDSLRGTEAVTILVGPSSNDRSPARHILCIPEQDDPIVMVGPRDPQPEVHVRSYADRWLARFIFPESWLPDEDEHLELALLRTHGDNMEFESAPNACVPWRMIPDKVRLDLSGWNGDGPVMDSKATDGP